MFTKRFWKDATERAIKTGAQAFIGFVAGEVLNVWSFDWATAAGIVLGGAVLSYATSLVSGARGDHNSASFIDVRGSKQ
jgi:NhaP-type Na+/H+ or K+/H+ antiporter